MDPGVRFRQREELPVLRRARVRDHGGQRGVSAQHLRDRLRPGVDVADGSGPGVDHHRAAGVGELTPDVVQQRMAGSKSPTSTCTLNT